MTVTASFLESMNQTPTPERMAQPRRSLHLRGFQLVDDSGRVMAELVQDKYLGYVWRVLAADVCAISVGPPDMYSGEVIITGG